MSIVPLGYIDPGSGTILLQALIASLVGGVAIFWGRIKAFFGGKPKTPADSPKSQDSTPKEP